MHRVTDFRRMRRLQIHRRSISRTETNSTEPSLTSGSMDSYATHPTSNATSEHDETQKWKDLTGSAVLSPGEMAAEDSPGTERQTSDPFDKLKPIDTVTGQDGGNEKDEREETVVFDSPISEEAQATPVTSGPAK